MHQIDMLLQKCRNSSIFPAILGRSLLMLLAGSFIASPNSAYADEAHYRVELTVAKNLPACDRKLDFAAILTTLLAKPLLEPPETQLFEVRIAKAPTGAFHVNLLTKDLDGREMKSTQHEFPGDLSCFEVLYKAALRSAIHMEMAASMVEASAPRPAPPPVPPAVLPQCPQPDPPPQKPQKAAPIERRGFVGAGGIVAFGVAPEIVAGGQLVGGWRWSSWGSVEANLSATIPQETQPSGATLIRLDTIVSATVAPCFHARSFGACGTVAWDNLWFERVGATHYASQLSASFRVGVRGFMEHSFADRWSVRVNADLAVPIVRSNIRDEAQVVRWSMPRMTGSVGGAVVVSF